MKLHLYFRMLHDFLIPTFDLFQYVDVIRVQLLYLFTFKKNAAMQKKRPIKKNFDEIYRNILQFLSNFV